jgi:hypothetical protein
MVRDSVGYSEAQPSHRDGPGPATLRLAPPPGTVLTVAARQPEWATAVTAVTAVTVTVTVTVSSLAAQPGLRHPLPGPRLVRRGWAESPSLDSESE